MDKLALSQATSAERERQRRHAERKVERQRKHMLRARVLEGLDVFRAGGLSRALLRRVAAAMKPAEYGAGETLVEEGAPGDRLFVITGGEVDFFQAGRKINSLGKDDYFGEVSLLDAGARSRRTATAVAATDVSVLSLHRAAFRRLFPDAAEAVGVAFRGWFFGGDHPEDDKLALGANELPPALAARAAMHRRSVTFRGADRARIERARSAVRRWHVGGHVIGVSRYLSAGPSRRADTVSK